MTGDVVEQIAHRLHVGQLLVGDGNAAGFLDGHIQLHSVQAVGLQVVGQAGLHRHLVGSIVSYLDELGYASIAAHPYTNSNYRRNSAWLALGFDEVYFEDSFPTEEYYGNRPYQTDSASYRDFAALYEAMPEDQPRFGSL